MGRFAELCIKHGCDKEGRHRYGDAYDILFRPFEQLHPLKILEIGIYKGASLRVLQEFVPHAEIWAIDIDPAAVALAPAGVRAIVGDQNDVDFLNGLVIQTRGKFDIIIDDGSHRVDHQRTSFEALWPFVAVEGLYVIEDLESSKLTKPKYNPTGMQTTLDMLLAMARDNVQCGRCSAKLPLVGFYRELAFLIRME
jgi:predicted O-methyltransferase YrrM